MNLKNPSPYDFARGRAFGFITTHDPNIFSIQLVVSLKRIPREKKEKENRNHSTGGFHFRGPTGGFHFKHSTGGFIFGDQSLGFLPTHSPPGRSDGKQEAQEAAAEVAGLERLPKADFPKGLQSAYKARGGAGGEGQGAGRVCVGWVGVGHFQFWVWGIWRVASFKNKKGVLRIQL